MTEKKVKLLSGLLSVLLGAVIGAGCYAIADRAVENNIPKIENTAAMQEGNMLITENFGRAIKLTLMQLMQTSYAENGVSDQAKAAYTITATVYPSTANTKLDWTVEFKNAESSWAKGKDAGEYLTVTPTSDGALTATVVALQPFAEQIHIKAAVRNDDSIYATCTADYAKRFTTSEMTLQSIGFTVCDDEKSGDDVILPLYSFSTSSPYWRDPESSGTATVYSFGLGTLAPEIVSTKIEVKASDEFLSLYNAAPYYSVNGNVSECLYKDWYTLGSNGLIYAELIDELSKPFAQNSNWCNEDDYTEFLKAISTYNSTDFYIRITATMRYGEKQVDEVKEYSCKFNRNAEVLKATALSLDTTALIY